MSKPSHDLDAPRLTQYLQDNIEGFEAPISIKKFPGGQSNPTYLVSAPGGKYVLRRKPFGKLLPSAHAIDREFAVIRGLQGTDVPVPTPYCLCDDESVIGSMFYVMSYVPGRIFWDPELPELEREQRKPVFLELVRIMAALHGVDVVEAGLKDYGNPGNYFERQLSRWTKQYRASETEKQADMESLIGWLGEHMPADNGEVSLIHGDYRLDNVMFHEAGARGIAVLDWELSTLGHPIADLAYFCAGLRMPEMGPLKGLAGVNRIKSGLPSEEEIVSYYCELRGISEIRHWNFYLAFSLFRVAAIAQGVYKRSLDGSASNAHASAAGKVVAVLSKLANTIREE